MVFEILVTKFQEINAFGPWYYPTQGPLLRAMEKRCYGEVFVLPVQCHLIPVTP